MDASKRRARLVLILGLLIALLAAGGTFLYASSAAGPSAPPVLPTSAVVVAARELPIRTALAATDLKVVQMNEDVIPPGVFKDTKEILGKVLIVPLSVGEPLLPAKFVPDKSPTFTVFPPGLQVS
ncbi:MAG: SAF domain-containing protein, partial [Candidatus Limnocylindria bacterium]|nr:SAF domain-containing protein [Candidatus Limnocylindria bacterium]